MPIEKGLSLGPSTVPRVQTPDAKTGSASEVLGDVEAGFCIQLGVEVGPEQISGFVASHVVVLWLERRIASRICLRARAKWPLIGG